MLLCLLFDVSNYHLLVFLKMRLNKICRACLSEKTGLKPLFGACVPSMLMTCAAIQVMEGDGLPDQICTQCLQMVNRAYSFKQLCEKSDATLRQYINDMNYTAITVESDSGLLAQVKCNNLYSATDIEQTSLFNDIFSDATTQSLVENFSSHAGTAVVTDLADTMESLQTIAEQCLPDTWEVESQLQNNSSQQNCDIVDSSVLFKCQFCEEIFKDEWTFGDHIKIHTGQSKYFSNMDNQVENSKKEKKVPPLKTYSCNVCASSFADAKSLKKHLREMHSIFEKKHICRVCGNRYRAHKLLMMHMNKHTGKKPYKCELCGKVFYLSSSLYKHKLIHNPERKHKCNVCDKAFLTVSNLTAHMRVHTGEKPFLCSVCDKAFATNVNLKIHIRSHTGEKPYNCTMCERCFSTRSSLKKHTMCHTGEKPYECWHCGSCFRQKETRDTHVRYHTQERPYTCQLCPKKYIAASHLRAHMKGHMGDRKYHCGMCNKKFLEAKTLNAHQLTHNQQKSYSCESCGKQFVHSRSLDTHLKSCCLVREQVL